MIFTEEQFEMQFSELMNAKLPLFRSIAVKIVNVAADADDAVQAALIKGWNHKTSFRNEAALSSWIARIVIRESYDILRRRMRERRKLADYEPEQDAEDSDETMQTLDRAIAELPEIYRETVHIAILSGIDTRSAAALLECSENTLYQRIYKAKALLRDAFRRYENE